MNVNGDCKVWEFKIKDGVKFEDGSAITSKEIAYGIARSFDPDLTGGPTYLQEWLAGTAQFDTAWQFTENPDVAAARTEHPGRQDAALRVRPAPLRPALRRVAAGHRAGAAGQGHRGEPTTTSPSPPGRTRSPSTPPAWSWSWSATRTGTRTPTRYATSTRTGSSGPSAPTRPRRPTGSSPTPATTRRGRHGAVPAELVSGSPGTPRSRSGRHLGHPERNPPDHQHHPGHRPVGAAGDQLRHRPRQHRQDLGGQYRRRRLHHPAAAGHPRLPQPRRLSGRASGNLDKARELLPAEPPNWCWSPPTKPCQERAAPIKADLEKAGFKIVVKPIPADCTWTHQEEGQPVGHL